MQNWNQWQLSAGAVTTPMPQPPVGYAAPGTDPMAMMQAYMQYYNQPAPSGHTAEQWAAAQQQNWVQWQQWQQQYQQWQAQYGEKYQETMKHMSAQSMGLASQAPPLPNVQPPPLPKEDAKPPLPPSAINMYQFTSMPPPNQNNLPLFPVKPPASNALQANAQNCPPNPPLPATQPPLPPENSSSSGSSKESNANGKRDSSTVSEPSSAKKLKTEDEDLTEAEKTFDAQFKQWEEQFNKWKQQNANHPDKTQYKQYEAKWTSWREKLIERREQMRRKREQQRQAAAKAEAEKNKNLPEDDKILNILSNTENQGLIDNLLGIGKTLGLTGKQNTNVPPPPPPPPATQTTMSDVQSTTTTSSQLSSQLPAGQVSGMNVVPPTVTSSPWNSQQWSSQYNAAPNLPNFPNFQSLSGVPPPPFGAPPPQMPPPNFTQPPPNFPGGTPNFSQPPPGFGVNDTRQSQGQNARASIPSNIQGRAPFGSNDSAGPDMSLLGPNDRSSNFDPADQSNSFGRNEHNRQKDGGAGSDRFGRDGVNKNFSDQPGTQFRPGEAFTPRDDRMPDNEQFRRDERGYQDLGSNQFAPQKMNFSSGNERYQHGNDRFGQTNDRFGSGADRFGGGTNRFASGSDRFGSMSDRTGSGNDRFGLGNDRFGPGNNRFGTGNDRFGSDDRYGSGSDRLGQGTDRFSANSDRFGPTNDQFGTGNERFNRNSLDRFDQKDGNDSRRDSFSSRGFNRNNHFESSVGLSPELKKLMEKRRAAMDVFKPSFLEADKNSSVGSLSESFKRIAGDSPFGMKTSNDYGAVKGNSNFAPRGSFGPTDAGNFRMPGTEFRTREPDFKPQGGLDFGSRCPPNYRGPMDNFGRDVPNASPQNVQDLMMTKEAKPVAKNVGNEGAMDKGGLLLGDGVQEPSAIKPELVDGVQTDLPKSVIGEQENDGVKRDSASQDYPVQSDIPLIEKPPWVGARLPEENVSQKEKGNDERGGSGSTGFGTFPEPKTQTTGNEQSCSVSTDDKNDTPSIGEDGILKKSDVLPFMGENDPKPEDLNMEPPPELPNLGPVSSDTVMESNDNLTKVPPLRGFPGVSEFDPRGVFDSPFAPRGMPFRPNAPLQFGPRGPSDGRFPGFQPRDSNMFPYNSPGPSPHQLGSRPPNDGQFGPRGLPTEQFVPKASSDGQFGSRVPNDQFGPQGLNNRQFGPSRPNDALFDKRPLDDAQFNSRGPTEGQFGFAGSSDKFFGTRRPNTGQSDQRTPTDNAFGSRGPADGHFPNRGLKDGTFGPRGFTERQFDAQGNNEEFFAHQGPSDRYSGQRGPSGGSNDFTSRNRDGQFNNRTPYGNRGPGEFRQRGQFDKINANLDDLSEKQSERSIEPGGPEIRGDGGRDSEMSVMLDSSKKMEQGQQYGPNEMQKPGWRQSYSKNSFGDIDQRSARDSGYTEKPSLGQSDALNQSSTSNADQRSTFLTSRSNTTVDITRSEKSITDTMSDFKSGYCDSSSSSDYVKFSSPNAFTKRSIDSRSSLARCPVGKEFCIEKQFNYNHGGASVDKKLNEHIPVKIIDYAHASRPPVQDRLTPVQCFDYGHGNLKPVVPDRETHPKKDFRNWEENEQNLREYTERVRRYEYFAGKKDYRRPVDYRQRRDSDGSMDDRRYERERRDKEVYRMRDRGDERMFDRMSDKGQDNRYQNDRSNNKERTQDRCEISHKEAVKENDKDDDRSKGNINWQDSTNKNITETKPQDNSIPDAQHALELPPKTMDMGKTPNCTMVDDLLCPPGRQNRPPKIAIILRGPPGSGKSFVAKLIKDKEVEQGGSAPRILSLDDYFLIEKEIESKDDNGKKVTIKEIVYEYEEAMEQSYVTSLVKAFKKNITDGFFNFIILDCINEKISDYEEMWSFAKTKGFKVYVCEMEMDLQICLKRNIHNRTEEEINRIIDYFEPTPSYHLKLDVNSMLQEHAIEEVHMEDSEETPEESSQLNEDSQDSQEDAQDTIGVSKWERMEAEDKLDRLDGLAKKKNEGKVQTMKDFLQVPDYYNMEDTSGKKRVRWADLEERKEQEKMRAVGFVVGHTNWDRMMDPTKGGSALTRTKYI